MDRALDLLRTYAGSFSLVSEPGGRAIG